MWQLEEDELYHMEVDGGDDIPGKDPRDDVDDIISIMSYWSMKADERARRCTCHRSLTKRRRSISQ
jgi:hypothetical protein